MKLLSIEPTPSPNSMKLNVSESLEAGNNYNYKAEETYPEAPSYVNQLLRIEGVKGFYRVADFIAIERFPKYDWEAILPEVRAVFGEAEDRSESGEASADPNKAAQGFGEIRVFIQKFRDIPMQVKLEVDGEEQRAGLPERFTEAVMEAQSASDNMIMERQWVEQTPRYGDPQEVKQDVTEELSAAYSDERLRDLIDQAFKMNSNEATHTNPFIKVTEAMLDDPDWKQRYAALDRMDPSIDDLPVLEKALHDNKVGIRRLAAVYLGMLEDTRALPYLYEALKDKTVTVRRTAGDALSDIGDAKAIPAMIDALKDPSKIVRWRAAMFLYEVGDETAIEALRNAQDDPEFEVALQIKMALERIEGGTEAKGSVWKQMTNAFDN
ncbi:conserved virulence factor C family protein [Tuberibacillus sp. Marseille-P3662]|uniref:conserved virulence factor C family protein n=1 Tax=Tuberibacillus sp. Marseille-P3662 TaxID=1965358 RepID=UPI000A1CD392|nr:conserved virulence factor C family protein [Tuberibacillus sp. Marseille-P3662]